MVNQYQVQLQALLLGATLMLLAGKSHADLNSLPSPPNMEDTSRIRAIDGSSCEARRSQATFQVGAYNADSRLNEDKTNNPGNTLDKDQGIYAQISIPFDLGGGRKPDCTRFQEIVEENAELDLQLKRLEVQLKMEKLKQMKAKINRSQFSE
ncbi:hypothetical protein ACWJJH_19530 [Endozoicomonadaceae bacterium StTr2]